MNSVVEKKKQTHLLFMLFIVSDSAYFLLIYPLGMVRGLLIVFKTTWLFRTTWLCGVLIVVCCLVLAPKF